MAKISSTTKTQTPVVSSLLITSALIPSTKAQFFHIAPQTTSSSQAATSSSLSSTDAASAPTNSQPVSQATSSSTTTTDPISASTTSTLNSTPTSEPLTTPEQIVTSEENLSETSLATTTTTTVITPSTPTTTSSQISSNAASNPTELATNEPLTTPEQIATSEANLSQNSLATTAITTTPDNTPSTPAASSSQAPADTPFTSTEQVTSDKPITSADLATSDTNDTNLSSPTQNPTSTTQMLLNSTLNAATNSAAGSFTTWVTSAATGLLTQTSRALISSSSSMNNIEGTNPKINPTVNPTSNSNTTLIGVVVGVIIGTTVLVILLGYSFSRIRKSNKTAVAERLAIEQLNQQQNHVAPFLVINPSYEGPGQVTSPATIIEIPPAEEMPDPRSREYLEPVPVINKPHFFYAADTSSSSSDPDSQPSSGIEKSSSDEPVENDTKLFKYSGYDVLVAPGSEYVNPASLYEASWRPADNATSANTKEILWDDRFYATQPSSSAVYDRPELGSSVVDYYDLLEPEPPVVDYEKVIPSLKNSQPSRPTSPLLAHGTFASRQRLDDSGSAMVAAKQTSLSH